MTVTTATSRIEYAGDGATTAFSVPFYFLANGDLKVYQADTLKTITTHYTVTGAGNPAGGTVTFVAAPGSSDDVVIYRDPAITQSTDYVENDPFPAESHETALDRLTMIAQRSRDLLTRAVRLPDGEADAASMVLPAKASRLSHVIGFDTLGNLTTYIAQAGTSLIDLAASTGSDLIGFIQSGTGAVLRTAQAKMREIVSVTDFGAFKDGTNPSATTAAIQAAIDYAKASSNVHCIEFPTGNYAVNAPINIKGGFGDGLTIKGNKSTVTGSHNGPVFELNGSLPSPAPEYRLNVLIQDFTVVGSGKANTGSRCIQIVNGANVQVNNCILRNAYKGLFGFGALICNFIQLNIRDNETGVEFLDTVSFSPNDIHFVNCQIIVNTVAVRATNFEYGSWSFYGCEIEGNNIPSGNATDGVRVCEFFGAGEVTFTGCHFESNNGQYNIFYDSPGGRHLNIIGSKLIPGDSAGSIVYVDNGELFVTGTHAAQNIGGNIVLTANTDNALIVGDTAGTVTGVLAKLTRIRNGQINVANAAVGTSSAGVTSKGSAGIAYTVEGSIQFNNSSGTRLGLMNETGVSLDASAPYTISTGFATVLFSRVAGVGFSPTPDNTLSLGEAPLRWSTVYAGTGAINTSDARTKQQVRDLDTAERAVAIKLKGLLRAFKFNDSVVVKGDLARIHFGVIAQDVKTAFESEGLVAENYALFCHDTWEDISTDILDTDGNPTGEVSVSTPSGDRYGIRYDELLAFILSSI